MAKSLDFHFSYFEKYWPLVMTCIEMVPSDMTIDIMVCLKHQMNEAVEIMMSMMSHDKQYQRDEMAVYQDANAMFEEFCHVWKDYIGKDFAMYLAKKNEECSKLYHVEMDMIHSFENLLSTVDEKC